MQTGFVDLPEKTVYYNENGVMEYGEQKINDAWYYFDMITGKMATGFCELPEKWVYYGSNGKMLYGEQKIGITIIILIQYLEACILDGRR